MINNVDRSPLKRSAYKRSADKYFAQWKIYPPAGSFVSPYCILGQKKNPVLTFSKQLQNFFNVQQASIFGSGTEAIYQVLTALREQRGPGYVVMGAYTCPSIAAASVRAGFQVILVDVDGRTLEMKSEELQAALGGEARAVVLSNLYGLPEVLPADIFKKTEELVVIDDACQSAFSRRGKVFVGAEPGTIGILSFGRGKAICSIGGGAVLSNAASSKMKSTDNVLPQIAGAFQAMCLSTLCWIGQHPLVYGMIARLPFLGIGETDYREQFPLKKLSSWAELSAAAQLQRFERTAKQRTQVALWWHTELQQKNLGKEVQEPFIERGFAFDGQVVPTRYPILLSSTENCDRLLSRLYCYGVSASYPYALTQVPELRPHLVLAKGEMAESVASRILTLPVHEGITLDVVKTVTNEMKEEMDADHA